MKSFKKNIILIFIMFLVINISGCIEVKATSLSTTHYTLQCIYADGGLYTRAYNATSGNYSNNRMSYNLRGVDDSSANQTSTFTFVNNPNYNVQNNDPNSPYNYWKCRPYLYTAVYKYDNEEGETDENGTTYYKFTESEGTTISNSEFGTTKTGWQSFWGITSDSEDAANNARSNAKVYKLMSYQIVLSDSAPKPNATLYYVKRAEQAAGTNKYITVMIYDNVTIVKSQGFASAIGTSTFSGVSENANGVVSNAPANIWINDPEPMRDVNGSKISYYFNAGATEWKISKSQQSGYTKYELTDEVPPSGGTGANGEVCDEMPETTLVLKDIIGYVQILMPVFLIILTAIDIGRIMLSGNVEDELPKQRKKIVTRFIAAVTIFFLPIIVNVLMDMMVDNSDPGSNSGTVKSIRCLFE